MSKYIPYGRQNILQEDIDAVIAVLNSDFLTQGPVVSLFEEAIAKKCSVRYGVAVNSATSALHLACMALGVGKGDMVWTSPISFVASANCALYCGANVDFVDIDLATYNMSVDALEAKLVSASAENRLPKVVIPVHMAGQSCDMEEIYRLSQRYGFSVIEDASHAVGATYKNTPVGSCQYSDITIFSFHPVKIITTGEGGMALTNSSELATKMKLLSSHGITRDVSLMKNQPDGDWYYEQLQLGYNYRMTDIQAALGLSQASRLTDYVNRRNNLAKNYIKELIDLPLILPKQSKNIISAFHLFIVLLDFDNSEMHQKIFKQMRDLGIGVNLHYIPIYKQPFYVDNGYIANCPNAENYYKRAISLPIYPDLKNTDQAYVINSLKEIMRHL